MQILKDNIRSRILDVAKQQFELKGYSKTSMREIAVDVGVGVGNIYNYFKSKDELFHEVVRPVLYALEMLLQDTGRGYYDDEVGRILRNLYKRIYFLV